MGGSVLRKRRGYRVKSVKISGFRYVLVAPKSRYWRPGRDYLAEIARLVRRVRARDGDIILVSEKAVSTAKGNIIDEENVNAGLLAKVIAGYWMRWVWGYVLGPLCGLRRTTIEFLRNYPDEYGAKHKQVALNEAGVLAALCFGSEGGIDGSNLPYAYVSLPLRDAEGEARRIREYLERRLGINTSVVIVDSDRCYSWGPLYVSPRHTSVGGIKGCGGVATYVLSNVLRLKGWPTPVACSGLEIPLKELLELCKAAESLRGHGAGRNVWEMAEHFGTTLVGVTWEMLESVPHYPVVVARKLKRKGVNKEVGDEDSGRR